MATVLPVQKRLRLTVKTRMPQRGQPFPDGREQAAGHAVMPQAPLGGPVAAHGALAADQAWHADLGPEVPQGRKAVYLVTLPHPRHANVQPGRPDLRAPDNVSHEDIERAFVDAFARPMYTDAGNQEYFRARGSQTVLKRMVIFKESHATGADGLRHAHFHVAIQGSASFRFAPYKRALLERHGLATHWGCSHEGYWSAVRYGALPSEKKPAAELDSRPRAWSHIGEHPRIFDAAQEPTTAAALRRRREVAVAAAAEAGRREPRPAEMDLYAVIVAQGFRNTPDDPHAAKRLVHHLLAHGTPALTSFAFKMRAKLPSLIDDVWAWETVADHLHGLGDPRLARVLAAAAEPCSCRGAWAAHAERILVANGVVVASFFREVAHLLRVGRHPTARVLVLAGRYGGEGKSFLLAPLRGIFGHDYVQESPQRGNFPLLGIEDKRIALLDDWRFNDDVIAMSTQLLWFEGKPVPVARPQNQSSYVGHLLYRGSAPIFVTTKEADLRRIAAAAEAARMAGRPCEETMLLRRLSVHIFATAVPAPGFAAIPECPACFASLVARHGGAEAAAVQAEPV